MRLLSARQYYGAAAINHKESKKELAAMGTQVSTEFDLNEYSDGSLCTPAFVLDRCRRESLGNHVDDPGITPRNSRLLFSQWTHPRPRQTTNIALGHPAKPVKTALALTPENATTLLWWSKLTGLPTEELINFCLAEYFHDFNKDNESSFPEETLGLLKFKDRESAKRTLEWVKSRVQKEHTGKFPIFESSIDELPDGRFQIDAFKTGKNGESNRVC
jgi:hypothetical protein